MFWTFRSTICTFIYISAASVGRVSFGVETITFSGAPIIKNTDDIEVGTCSKYITIMNFKFAFIYLLTDATVTINIIKTAFTYAFERAFRIVTEVMRLTRIVKCRIGTFVNIFADIVSIGWFCVSIDTDTVVATVAINIWSLHVTNSMLECFEESFLVSLPT